MTYGDVYEQLQKIVAIHQFLIAKENHADGGLHFHVLLTLRFKCDFKNPNCLDLMFDKIPYHGNYQSAKNKNALILYLTKEDPTYQTNMKFEIVNNELVSPEAKLANDAKTIGIKKAMDYFKEKYPERAIKKFTMLEKNLSAMFAPNNEVDFENFEFDFKSDFEFTNIPFEDRERLLQWVFSEKPLRRTLILKGPTGVGKSLLAIAILKLLQKRTIRITDLQGFKSFSEQFEALLGDDLSINSMNLPATINFFDTSNDSDVRLLFQVKRKPKGLIQIFTINELDELTPHLNHKAVQRRTEVINIPNPIIFTQNYFLNIQNVNITNQSPTK